MSVVVPNVGTRVYIELMLGGTLTAKLYSNNKVPALTDTAASYTPVSGGGYANKSLTFANWDFTTANPALAIYNAFLQWSFTGATDAPGTIYGYYIVNAGGTLIQAERFPAGSIPFSPINGSYIKVKPRITVASANS